MMTVKYLLNGREINFDFSFRPVPNDNAGDFTQVVAPEDGDFVVNGGRRIPCMQGDAFTVHRSATLVFERHTEEPVKYK